MSSIPRKLEVAAALVFHRQRLLITQRRAGDHLGGLWEFPGGKLEPGETFPQALRRELAEELGIEVQVGDLLATIEHPYPDRCVHLRFHRCRLTHGTPKPLGCDAIAWVTPDQLAEYPFPPADAQLLHQIIETPDLWKD